MAGRIRRELLEARRADGDPYYDLRAICDINEALAVRAENEHRAAEAARPKKTPGVR